MKLATSLLLALLLCGCSRSKAIIVASKNFTEQLILGEIAAQQIERKLHVQVERKLDLGGTLLTHGAILNGQIDIYPEYTGTASSVVLKTPIPPDPGRAYLQVKDQYLKRFQLVWLPPLGFNDTFAMVVRSPDAQKLPSPTLTASKGRAWRLGVGYEFLTRPDGLRKLDQVYAIPWRGTPESMDLGLLYRALGQGQIDMIAANSTDSLLTDSRYAVLADDRHTFPPYSACFVIRQSVAQQQPAVEMALTMLSNHLTDETMRSLNRRVDVDHQPVERVARDFLVTQQ